MKFFRSRLYCVLLPAVVTSLMGQSDSTGSAHRLNRVETNSGTSVILVRNGENDFTLRVDGKDFRIKGAGGDGSKELLKSIGGNSIRTWGINGETGELLDEAHANGLKVALGFWLGHERHGFSYENYEHVTKQLDDLRAAVTRYKDHPALLMWSIGNEMEGFAAGDNPAIWTHIEHCARLVKSIDPDHPVMTVTAEIGGRKVEALHRFCPSIDIFGINSYGGIESLAERYRKAGGTKPYLVTEFGPPGTWETPPGKWGMPNELSSTDKGPIYGRAYQAIAKDPLCLGGYAFTWGAKQEASATWFGMLLPSGERLAPADALCELWRGTPPPNRCPEIESLTLVDENVEFDPGAEIEFAVSVSDPENDALETQWVLAEDWKEVAEGGDARPSPPKFPDAIIKSDEKGATFKLPEGSGTYRAYVYVTDGNGGAATANVSIKVKGDYQPGLGSQIKLPFVITGGDPKAPQLYAASGWMGDTDKMKLTLDSRENPKIGDLCLKLDFTEPAGWGGIVWQSPAGDWGDQPGGFDLTGAKKLTFWAKGEKGGETARFGLGIIGEDKKFYDTHRVELPVTLTDTWQKYEIPLEGKDLTRIKSGFHIVTEAKGLPFTLFVDEVTVE